MGKLGWQFLISSTSLNLDPVLVVLLVVELRTVVQHQVQIGGRVTLVHADLTAANTVPLQNVEALNKHLVSRCGWKTWSWSPASSLPPTYCSLVPLSLVLFTNWYFSEIDYPLTSE